MGMFRKIVLSLVAVSALAGCQSAAFGVHTEKVIASQRPATSSEIDSILEAMREHMNDPYSVRDAEISNVFVIGGMPTVCVKANAKNLMGAYIGRRTVMVYMRNGKPSWVNEDPIAVSGCDLIKFRKFTEISRLSSL